MRLFLSISIIMFSPLVSNLHVYYVSSLRRNPEIYSRLVTLMIKFPDLDKMLNGLTYRAKTMTINTARVGSDTL